MICVIILIIFEQGAHKLHGHICIEDIIRQKYPLTESAIFLNCGYESGQFNPIFLIEFQIGQNGRDSWMRCDWHFGGCSLYK